MVLQICFPSSWEDSISLTKLKTQDGNPSEKRGLNILDQRKRSGSLCLVAGDRFLSTGIGVGEFPGQSLSGMCVCSLLSWSARPLRIWYKKSDYLNVSGADCQNVLSWLLFLRKLANTRNKQEKSPPKSRQKVNQLDCDQNYFFGTVISVQVYYSLYFFKTF